MKVRGIEGWQRELKRSTSNTGGVGPGDSRTQGWDVEPEIEADSDEDEVIVRRKKVEKKNREKQDRKKDGEQVSKKARRDAAMGQDGEGHESGSDSGNDDAGDDFVSCLSAKRFLGRFGLTRTTMLDAAP